MPPDPRKLDVFASGLRCYCKNVEFSRARRHRAAPGADKNAPKSTGPRVHDSMNPRVDGSTGGGSTESGSVAGSGAQPLLDNDNNGRWRGDSPCAKWGRAVQTARKVPLLPQGGRTPFSQRRTFRRNNHCFRFAVNQSASASAKNECDECLA